MTRRSTRARASGFTLLEVMMTLAIMMVALMGIVSLERAAVRANIESRSTSVAATNNARWSGILRRLALKWNSAQNGLSGLEILGGNQGVWTIPVTTTDSEPFALDWYGQPTTTAADFRYCTLIRMRSMNTNLSMRVEVVTFWAAQVSSSSGGTTAFVTLCANGQGANAGTALFGATPNPNLRHVRSTILLRRVAP